MVFKSLLTCGRLTPILCALIASGAWAQTSSAGETLIVAKQIWCMESKEALSEVQDLAARGNYEELTRIVRWKAITTLEVPDPVKVLDRTFGGAVKLRTAGGQECWTVENALRRASEIKQVAPNGNDHLPPALPIPGDVTYTVIHTDQTHGVKRSLEIRISRKVPAGVLRTIATILKDSDPGYYERTFITYYLPGTKVGAGAWATTHFDPDLKIEILGVSVEEEKSLAGKIRGSPGKILIGKWLDEQGGSVISIYQANGKLYIEEHFKDGSSSKGEAMQSRSAHGSRFEAKEDSDGDYYVINRLGNLELRDREGLIRIAKRIG